MKEGTDDKGPDDKVVTFDPKRKRKLKELKPQKHRQPQQPLTFREALVQSLKEDDNNQAQYFDECYARLLRAQAKVASAFLEPDDEKREALTERLQDQEGEALWDVIHAHGIHCWQIARKLKLLEQLLRDGSAIGSWYDQREFFMLASVRMDLERSDPLKAVKQKLVGKPAGDDGAA
jgi:hypothetical protein